MKHMTKILAIAALGIALGGAAHATNDTSCQHSQQQNQYHCNVNGTNYTVSGVSSAEAAAAAIATSIAQGGAGGAGGDADATGGSASATGGTATASNGNQSMTINNPKQPRITGVVGLNVDLGDLGRMKTDNLAKIVATIDAAKDKCMAAKVMNLSPALFSWITGKRLTLSC